MNNSHPYYDDYGFYVEIDDNKVNPCEGIMNKNGETVYCESDDTQLVAAVGGAVFLCERCAADPINFAYSALGSP